jgi:hypothetical protein
MSGRGPKDECDGVLRDQREADHRRRDGSFVGHRPFRAARPICAANQEDRTRATGQIAGSPGRRGKEAQELTKPPTPVPDC